MQTRAKISILISLERYQHRVDMFGCIKYE